MNPSSISWRTYPLDPNLPVAWNVSPPRLWPLYVFTSFKNLEFPTSTWEFPTSTWEFPTSTWEFPTSTWEFPTSTWNSNFNLELQLQPGTFKCLAINWMMQPDLYIGNGWKSPFPFSFFTGCLGFQEPHRFQFEHSTS